MPHTPIRGIITPTITPLKPNGDINPAMIRPLVDFLIDRGISGIYPLGSTGEGPLFSIAERQAIAEAIVKAVAGRVPVIVHTGAITTAETIALTRHARDIGADAASVLTPWYYRLSEAALESHYRAVYEALPDFPIYLYNLPAFTGNNLSLGLVTRLASEYEHCAGLKDSSGDLQTMFAANHLRDGSFNTCIGPDMLILAGLSMGLDAAVSGHSNMLPELLVGLYEASVAGELERARELQRRLKTAGEVIASAGGMPLFKALLAERGLPVGGMRAPLQDAPGESVRACVAQLRALKADLSRA